MLTYRLRLTTALVLAALPTSAAWAATAGTLIFAQPGVQILDASGVPRPARKGDVVQEGERLLTPPNAIAQLGLTDGSLLGLRPGSELKLELPPQASDTAQKVVTLLQGAIRVIGGELLDKRDALPLLLNAGSANLQLRAADLESEVVRPDMPNKPDGAAAGSYSKLLLGSGEIKTGDLKVALPPREVSFVGSGSATLTTVAAMPTKLALPTLTSLPAKGTSDPAPGGTTTLKTGVIGTTALALAPVSDLKLPESKLSTATILPVTPTSSLSPTLAGSVKAPVGSTTLTKTGVGTPVISTASLGTVTAPKLPTMTAPTVVVPTFKPVIIAPTIIPTTIKPIYTCKLTIISGRKVCL